MSLVNEFPEQLPEGLGFRLAMDMKAMSSFANMPENNKKQMIDYIKSSTTGEEAKNRVTEVVSNLHNGGSFQ